MNTCEDCRHAVPIYPTASGKMGLFDPARMTHCSIPRAEFTVQQWGKSKFTPCAFNPSKWASNEAAD